MASLSTGVTTASTTDVLLTGLSLTPGAGNYMVHASVSIDANSGGSPEFAVLSIYVGGTQVANSERTILLPRQTFNSGSTQAYITNVGASDAIEVRWRTTTAKLITANERALTLIEMN